MYFRFLRSPKYDAGVIQNPKFEDKAITFSQGRLIASDMQVPVEFAVDCTADEPPPDLTGYIIPVMSNRLIEALRNIGVVFFFVRRLRVRLSRVPANRCSAADFLRAA